MYFYIKIREVFILNIFPCFVSPKEIFFTDYMLTNTLFVLKYLERIEIILSYFSACIWIILVISTLFFHQKLKFFLISLPDIDLIKKQNPFNVQTGYASKILIVVSLLLPFLCSFKVKKSGDIFRFATYILGGLMVVTFILNCIEEGFYENVIGNLFDISYLSMIIPFIIFYFLVSFKNKNAIFFDKC